MPKHIARLAAGTVVALSLLTACSGGTGGTAETPAPGNPSPSSPDNSSSNGVPKVPAPLPTEKLLADPCSALGDDANAVGLASPGKLNDITPRGCDWQSSDPDLKANGVTLAPVPQNKNGLADTYATKSRQAYFEPTQISGYPAVFTAGHDSRKNGVCDLVIGVTDQLTVVIVDSISKGKNLDNPCEPLTKIGAAMINHLKTAS
ncbi:DUF3558 domain-containing protein [Amycolatopsis echigonensis]|uniref:DUF3558 domain-containing protein n=1 Tax=Amycolatopsis echigonensis TaxID=2576905 RepID=A0A8E1W368_9PSEU|nr:DUF3558 domain-containing protein [Amycolatopsis echigonensis]MBB2503348.1 DUF3558 domain-containing protein [Amycolatopsis echigonensis]